jgi:CRP-like cAMP-binding protein
MAADNLRNQLDKALERMDRCLGEAVAAQTEIRGLLKPKEANVDREGPGITMLDRYHELALSNQKLRINPIEQPKNILDDDPSSSMVVRTSGCCGSRTPIIHPDHTKLLAWTLIGALFICYDVLMMPYRMCFSAPAKGPMFAFEASISVYFIMDLVLNFFIGYITVTGDLVSIHSMVIKRYVTTWFPIDFLASFPVDLISYAMTGSGSETGRLLRMARGLRLLKLVRIFRIGKLKRLFDKFEQELEGSAWKMLIFAIGKILLLLFSIGHLACCFWYYTGISWQDHYGVSWLTEKMPTYDVDPWLLKSSYYLWSFHYSMATMTTVGYGDISPTNTAEVVYTYALLWTSLIVFSGCLGILMNLITSVYEEGQERRRRMIELSKYMQWRVLPRQLRLSIRRYLGFVWDINEKVGETEAQLMENLSPTLRMSLCVHIFGTVLVRTPFLSWMKAYPGAIKKLALRTVSLFRDCNDMLFSFGEVDATVYVLVNGWVTLSLGAPFEEEHTDMHAEIRRQLGTEATAEMQKDKIAVARRSYTATFDPDAADLDQRAGIKGQDVFDQVHRDYVVGSDKVRKSVLALAYTQVASEKDRAYVQAPAFFGENALYFDEPPPKQYSAKCLTRSELTTLTKEDIEHVVQELPYIKDTYDAFIAHMLAQAGLQSEQNADALSPPKEFPSTHGADGMPKSPGQGQRRSQRSNGADWTPESAQLRISGRTSQTQRGSGSLLPSGEDSALTAKSAASKSPGSKKGWEESVGEERTARRSSTGSKGSRTKVTKVGNLEQSPKPSVAF